MIPPSILLSPLTSVLFVAANVTGCTPYSHRYIISRGGFTDSSSIHCWVFFWWRVHPIAALLWILCLDSSLDSLFGFFDSHSLPSYSGSLPAPFFLHYCHHTRILCLTHCSIALSPILTSHFRHSYCIT